MSYKIFSTGYILQDISYRKQPFGYILYPTENRLQDIFYRKYSVGYFLQEIFYRIFPIGNNVQDIFCRKYFIGYFLQEIFYRIFSIETTKILSKILQKTQKSYRKFLKNLNILQDISYRIISKTMRKNPIEYSIENLVFCQRNLHS